MSSQTLEQHFVARTAYHKPVSETSTPVSAVEAWLDEHPKKRLENQVDGGTVKSGVKKRKPSNFVI